MNMTHETMQKFENGKPVEIYINDVWHAAIYIGLDWMHKGTPCEMHVVMPQGYSHDQDYLIISDIHIRPVEAATTEEGIPLKPLSLEETLKQLGLPFFHPAFMEYAEMHYLLSELKHQHDLVGKEIETRLNLRAHKMVDRGPHVLHAMDVIEAEDAVVDAWYKLDKLIKHLEKKEDEDERA